MRYTVFNDYLLLNLIHVSLIFFYFSVIVLYKSVDSMEDLSFTELGNK